MDIGGVGLLVYSSFNDRPGQVPGNEFAKVREYIMHVYKEKERTVNRRRGRGRGRGRTTKEGGRLQP